MTHADIYTKFLIEYDKANVTSSYPDLTKYEIATILDKAYLALISQKINGNNTRNASIENDVMSIEDIQPLFTRSELKTADVEELGDVADNEYVYDLPIDMFHYVSGSAIVNKKINNIKKSFTYNNIKIIPNTVADKYKVSSTNLPWIDNPVCYLEDNNLRVLLDAYNKIDSVSVNIEYVKFPKGFTQNISNPSVDFELNDSAAEELINLAIVMSLEIVESPRLDSKIKTLSLES